MHKICFNYVVSCSNNNKTPLNLIVFGGGGGGGGGESFLAHIIRLLRAIFWEIQAGRGTSESPILMKFWHKFNDYKNRKLSNFC